MVLPGKGLGAVSALEGRFPRVLPHVVDEMFSARERLGAEVAAMRRFTRVLSHMI